jgi:sugar transferase (PEP-CTERM/EpsH1 system associated)
MSDLLFLAHRLPYPPNKGEKIRAWHMFRHLAATHRVHLGCFYDDPEDAAHVATLAPLCASLCCLPLDPRWARLKSLRALASGAPISTAYFADARLAAWVAETVRRHRPRQAFVFCSAMAPYALRHPVATRILDMVDVDSEKWRQYAATSRGPLRALYAREARTLLALERRAVAAFDATLLVSAAEADAFTARTPAAASRLRVVENGVDDDYFRPDGHHADPYPDGRRIVVFTGVMDYRPNIDAVQWFAREVMPRLIAVEPEAEFWIVGSRPAPAVLRLAGRPGIKVTGRVPDVRPYLAHADAVVAPLRIARGIQNKVLEGMAMARPVVATAAALEGLAVRDGGEVLGAETPEAYVTQLVRAFGAEGQAIGGHARARIEADYRWPAKLAALDHLFDEFGPDTEAGRAAMLRSVAALAVP